MKKIYLLALLALCPLLLGASSAVNFNRVGDLGGFQGSHPTSYTPTLSAGWGTPTSVDIKYARLGAYMHIWGSFITGTVAGSLASISLPSGYELDTGLIALQNNTSNPGPHFGYFASGSGNAYAITAIGTSTTLIYAGGSATLTPQNGSSSFVNSQYVSVSIMVPIKGWGISGGSTTYSMLGTAYYDTTTSLGGWTANSLTFTDFPTDTDAPAPTVQTVDTTCGTIQTTDNNLPQVTVNSMCPGSYKVCANFTGYNSSNGRFGFRISDGTTNGPDLVATSANSDYVPFHACWVFQYTSSANRTFKLQGRNNNGSVNIVNADGEDAMLTWTIEKVK